MGPELVWRMGLGLLLAAGSACLPLASPPLRVRASVGPTTFAEPEQPELEGEPAPEPAQANAVTQLSFGLHPLQLSRRAARGDLDIGLGYEIETVAPGPEQRVLHGAELELGWYPLHFDANGTRARFGPFWTAEALALRGHPEAPWGHGASMGAALELTGFADGGFAQETSEGGVAGIAAGQWALGVFAAGGMRNFGSERYWTATFGVSGRIPFLIGVVCCAFDLASGDGASGGGSNYEPPEPASRSRETKRHKPVRRTKRTPARPAVRRR